MKFRVHLGFRENYLFDSADEAMRFAITAKVKREDQERDVSEIILLTKSELEAEKEEGDDD